MTSTHVARTAPVAAATAPRTATTAGVAIPHLFILAVLIGIGLGLRVWFAAVNELQPIYSPADDGDYYQRALRFATTGLYIDDFWLIRPPLHVVLFALMIRVSIWLGTVDGLL
ncbi:MAG: hypothetical protein HC876_22920, partial [Chloroflexaceae bacterium]|nr:hypothetical protein [Chloroflexaceae bacterium]